MMIIMLTIRMIKDHIDDDDDNNDDDGHPYDASSHIFTSKINPYACTTTTLPVRLPL